MSTTHAIPVGVEVQRIIKTIKRCAHQGYVGCEDILATALWAWLDAYHAHRLVIQVTLSGKGTNHTVSFVLKMEEELDNTLKRLITRQVMH